jgi:hypothetical protein
LPQAEFERDVVSVFYVVFNLILSSATLQKVFVMMQASFYDFLKCVDTARSDMALQ